MPEYETSLTGRLSKKYRDSGLVGVANSAFRSVFPYRMKATRLARNLLQGKSGLEVGGPSFRVFGERAFLPVYPVIGTLDNCNYSFETSWEGKLTEGQNFHFQEGKPLGWQFVREASDLRDIPSGKYDFLLSSHCLEHVANPLKALDEWKRVISDQSVLVIVVPNLEGTFDRRRPVTTLKHMIEDYQNGVEESDTTHFDEIFNSYGEPGESHPDPEGYRAHLSRNHQHRQNHHHTFNAGSFSQLLDYAGLQLLAVESCPPFNTLAMARKLSTGESPDNTLFLGPDAPYRRTSPFSGDRA